MVWTGLRLLAGRLSSAAIGLRTLVCVALVASAVMPALAIQPDEILNDPELEKRARQISLELRCVVCQNQSIDDSDAPLARDLRLLVRERLEEGDSNEEVMEFVVSRYGEFVLLRPPFGWHTLLLWLAPALVLIGAVYLARQVMGTARRETVALESNGHSRLSEEEEAKLKDLLDRDKGV